MSDRYSAFRITYEGAAVANHEMDVKELAPALLAVGELLEEVNRVVNPSRVKLTVNIRATNEGSIIVELAAAQALLDQAQNLFSGDGITAILNAKEILGLVFGGSSMGLIGLIKKIRGRKIKNVIKLESGNFQIEIEGGEILLSNETEINLFSMLSIRKKTEQFIRKPLSSSGIDRIKIDTEETQETVERSEAESFIAPIIDEQPLQETRSQVSLQLINITLQGDYKWRFSDGTSSFMADMLDEDFRKRIEKNEIAFSKDDILIADVLNRQFLVNGELKSEKSIIKVVDHKCAAAMKMKLPGM